MKPTKLSARAGRGFQHAVWRLALAASLVPACFAVQPSNLETGNGYSSGKIARDIQRSNSKALIDVIVQFKVTPRTEHYLRMSQRGAVVKTKLHGIRAAAFRIPAFRIAELEKDPDILYVTPDRPTHLRNSSEENFSTAVQADMAAQIYSLDGTGIGIAVIDSGVADHPDLHNASGTSRVVYSQSFVAGDTTTVDTYGHGTHVSGIAAGNGAASAPGSGYATQFMGMAPNANIINLRVLDRNGSGTDSQVIAAIQQAIQLQSQYNIRVINLSLGRPVFESYTLDPLCQAVEQAWNAGIVVVVAAGNTGRDNSHGTAGFATIDAPGNDPAVITVGASRTL
jgi:serine protease AprX